MPVIAKSTLDDILTIQLNLAWAGEHDCEPPRLSWWKVNLSEPANGGDLMRRLAPTTWRFSALAALREAGRRADAARAGLDRQGDRFSSIFRVTPLVDEKLQERLRDLRTAGRAPHTALPRLLFRLTDVDADSAFHPGDFADWLASLDPQRASDHTLTPTGMRLVGEVPQDPLLRVQKLASLLRDHTDPSWPFPYAEVNA